jgi:2-iminobutanoate/2-iminopropanoate deaminase
VSFDDVVPTPIGPYAPLIRAGDWLVCSGQLGLQGGEIVPGGVAEELRCAITNLEAILAPEGATLNDVVKTTVFLIDIADFDLMNKTYVAAFADHRPTRSAFAVSALPRGAQVEIEAWAYLPAEDG